MTIERAPIRAVLPVYLAQGAEEVHVVSCCGRVYVGLAPAAVCRTCKNPPVNHVVKTDGSNLDTLP